MNGTVAVDRSAIKLSMPEKTPEKPWTNLFATNRMAARGINLTYIAPIIVDGEKVVEILAEDLAEDDVKWKPSVVVYVVGTAPSIGVMERFILGQGNFSSKLVVLYHTDGYFVVRPIGSQVQLAEIKDFKDCMINSNLSELHTVGRQYTWTNGHVCSRIDRALVNDEWVLRMPPVQVMVMEPLFSDLTSEYRIGSTKGHKKETIQ
ncbi:hypothetical protein H5410_051842 [Solanum commersonii]|uniref:Uncharacterized protein n=1 Tax=Solanum commersonii TaxID=4109 RepID=A0A9J5X0L4_SOLCO|nr:hypothetical protein H5410_051842 [Solanum commersonii]